MNFKQKTVIFILISTILLSSCLGSEEWSLFYFPDNKNIPSADKSHNYITETYKTFKQCQNSGVGKVRNSGNKGAYECGKNCKINTNYGMLICETTRK